MKIGLIGSTGMVGGAFLELFEERNFPISELRPFASSKSAGQKITYKGQEFEIQELSDESIKGLDIVFVATGEDISEKWTPVISAQGTYVVDNSSAFRMDPNTPLVCPEVNGDLITKDQFVYANPNCSTIQLVVLLNALKNVAGMNSVTVSSYQAVSGAGKEALKELQDQSRDPQGVKPEAFPKQIAYNCIPQIGGFDQLGFTSEEQKIMRETKKILSLPNLKVSAQTVRVPVMNGHAESVWVDFEKEVSFQDIIKALENQEGLVFTEKDYDTQIDVSGRDEVFVSRVRRDQDFTNRWIFWVVADNIRKGAATNAIQISEKILAKIS
jgi:aspartate-semialdehyde dehydrogenase